uniref:Secreted protein n=1 Tax=Ascaris lumbricoides TaxID=6252 RepID=A0A9J2P6K3_ASCLU
MQTVVVIITLALLTLPSSRCIPRYGRMIGTEQWTSNTSQDTVEQSSSDSDVMPLWWTYVRERKNILSNMMRIGRRSLSNP